MSTELRLAEPSPHGGRPPGRRRRGGRLGRLGCALGRHRMRYVGVQLGQRIERCERCSLSRQQR